MKITNLKWIDTSDHRETPTPTTSYDAPLGAQYYLTSGGDLTKPIWQHNFLWHVETRVEQMADANNEIQFQNNFEYRYDLVTKNFILDVTTRPTNGVEDLTQLVFTPNGGVVTVTSSDPNVPIVWQGFDVNITESGTVLRAIPGHRYSILFTKLKDDNTVYANVMRY